MCGSRYDRQHWEDQQYRFAAAAGSCTIGFQYHISIDDDDDDNEMLCLITLAGAASKVY